jgi:hypothetical protein
MAPQNASLIIAQIKTDPDASPHMSLFFVETLERLEH